MLSTIWIGGGSFGLNHNFIEKPNKQDEPDPNIKKPKRNFFLSPVYHAETVKALILVIYFTNVLNSCRINNVSLISGCSIYITYFSIMVLIYKLEKLKLSSLTLLTNRELWVFYNNTIYNIISKSISKIIIILLAWSLMVLGQKLSKTLLRRLWMHMF